MNGREIVDDAGLVTDHKPDANCSQLRISHREFENYRANIEFGLACSNEGGANRETKHRLSPTTDASTPTSTIGAGRSKQMRHLCRQCHKLLQREKNPTFDDRYGVAVVSMNKEP